MDEGWDRIQPRLLPGERLLWSGRPDPAKWFSPIDLYLVPFSILWCSFAIFWESSVLASGKAPGFFLFFGGFFVVIGLYFTIGRFFVKRAGKRKTLYALTTSRALILTGENGLADCPIGGTSISSSRSRDGKYVTVRFGDRAGGSFFGNGMDYGNTGMELFGMGRARQFAFYDVPNPDALDAALSKARSRAVGP
jgi:hypothetical protein